MSATTRTAIADAYRRWRRGPRTLIDCASRVEFDARELRDATPLSPARLIVAIADTAQACGHLADATDGWARWLSTHAEEVAATHDDQRMTSDLTAAVMRALSGLGSIADQLRAAQREAAGETTTALSTLARHDPQPRRQP